MGGKAKSVPCGSVDAERGACPLPCGSAATTRDGLGETLAAQGEAREEAAKAATRLLQRHSDPGPERRGRRTPVLHRMGQLADALPTPSQRLYAPPYPSHSHPRERCWGLWAWPWKGTKRIDAATLREWAQKRTWKGRYPVIDLSRTGYHKGIARGKTAMQAVAAHWKRAPQWPKDDIVINPASTS